MARALPAALVAWGALFAPCAGAAAAAAPLTLVVSAAVGGGIDRVARVLAMQLESELGRPVVVENRSGAGTRIASEYVATWARPGDALLLTSGSSTVDLAFAPEGRPNVVTDFAPVTELVRGKYLVIVDMASPIRDVGDLLARARAQPGKLSYGTVNVQSPQRLIGELLKLRTRTDMVQIPYQGEPAILLALQARDLDFAIMGEGSAQALVASGRVRALAVAGERRSALAPSAPTLAEAGIPGIDVTQWYGLLARGGTPPAAVDAYADAARRALKSPEFVRLAETTSVTVIGSTPAEFARRLADDYARLRDIVVTARLVP